jgi:HD-like signal output (HDOD) protein
LALIIESASDRLDLGDPLVGGVGADALVIGTVQGDLHDIGKIPLNNRMAKEYVQAVSLTDRDHIPLYQSEERLLSVHHAAVGKLIVENWHLGENLSDAVANHHHLDC